MNSLSRAASLATICLSLCLVCPALRAQSMDAGPFVGLPVTVTAHNPAFMPGHRMFQKKAGYGLVAPIAPGTASPSVPDFSYPVVFGFLPNVEVDAMSIGFDVVLADTNGRIDVPTGGWGATLFSVSTVVGTPDPDILAEVSAADGVAADVFSYALPGSILPTIYQEQTVRAMDSTELGLFHAPSSTPGTIRALDAFLYLFDLDPDIAAILPRPVTMYFSLTHASALAISGAGLWGGTIASGATILQRTWNEITGTWNLPTVFLSYSDLGYTNPDNDVDALAIDAQDCELLYSLTMASPAALAQSQIRYATYCPDGAISSDYMTSDGTATAASRMGTGENPNGQGPKTNVSSICTEDPASGWALPLPPLQGQINYAPFTTGQPIAPLPVGLPVRLSSSVFRTCTSAGTPAVTTSMVGWPSASGLPSDGWAIFWVYLPGTLPYALPAIRRSTSPYFGYGGAPVTIEFSLPSTLLFGVEVDTWWTAVSDSFELAQSPAVRIAL